MSDQPTSVLTTFIGRELTFTLITSQVVVGTLTDVLDDPKGTILVVVDERKRTRWINMGAVATWD